MSIVALAPRTPVRCTIVGSPPLYARLLRTPRDTAAGLLYVRLTADHGRARKGERIYVRASETRPYRRGRHASGVRRFGPSWLRLGALAW